MDIARPAERAIALATRPRGAHEVENLRFAEALEAVEEGPRVHRRVEIRHLERRPEVVAVDVEIVNAELRFRLVEPEEFDALVPVVGLDLGEQILARARIGRVEEHRLAHPVHVDAHAAVHADEVALFEHLLVPRAAGVDRRPDGNHELGAHRFELLDHRRHVGPVDRVKLPLALHRPVEKVGHDDVHRQSAPVVLARHAEQLGLRLVAHLALREAQTVLGDHRHRAGDGGVLLDDLRRPVAGGDPVIELQRVLHLPLGDVLREAHAAHGRVVPEETVPAIRESKRHRALRVAVRQFEDRALLVEVAVLVLAEAVETLAILRFETRGDLPVAAEDRVDVAPGEVERAGVARDVGAVAPVLFEEQLALLVVETQPALAVHLRGDLAVGDRSGARLAGLRIGLDLHHGAGGGEAGILGARDERPVVAGEIGASRRAHAQGVVAPGFDDESLRVVGAEESSVVVA